MKQIGKWMQGIMLAVLIAVITMNGVLLAKRIIYKEELPALFGYSMITVLSGSMEPEFSPGDSLIIRKQAEYEEGDIVTYGREGAFITHRIVETESGSYRTKGDANNAPDDVLIPKEAVYGKVSLVIPCVGNFVLFLKSSLGIFTMIVLLLFLVEFSAWRGKRKENMK